MKCVQAPNLCHSFDCSIKAISRSKKTLNAYCKLQNPISDMVVHMLIEMKNSKNIYNKWATTEFNYCTDIGKGHIDFLGILEVVVNQIEPLTKIKPCPMKVCII